MLGTSKVTEILGPEPISLEVAKSQLRVSWDSHDELIEDLIAESRAHAESLLFRALVRQTRTAYFDCFNSVGNKALKFFGPASSVTSVTYRDENGDDQTLTVDVDYRLGTGEVATITPLEEWPDVTEGPECVRIVYTAEPGIVSPGDKRLMKALLTEWYDKPNDYIKDRKTLSDGIASLTRNIIF